MEHGGDLVLGSILCDPDDPQSSINSDIPFSQLVGLGFPKVSSVEIPHCEYEISSCASTGASLGLRILGMFSGPGASITRPNRQGIKATLSQLQISSFNPTREYIAHAIASSRAARVYVRSECHTEPVTLYMVTGTQVVHGHAKIADYRENETAIAGNLGLGSAVVEASVAGEHKRGGKVSSEREIANPFIFAYRVHQFTVDREGACGKVGVYKEGALLSVDEAQEERCDWLRINLAESGEASDTRESS
ncbi:hypothetical protein NLG97_g7734 [Lecanicillium saksenae]|uniref:Uncharacterized protein n=1 Tax=Lecanicillium saksenae TaxID=468837 RepID=A0ACC1QNX6_9HYPO|nr:hypothetical protein NLG97_g7734 [Lecanicillium saksenae]